MKKKLVSIILTLAMVLTMLPLSALAASWTVNLNGSTVTLTENDDGSITSDPDQSQYYTFKKVADQDVFHYYTFENVYVGQLTGTPVTVEDECTCETKCDPSNPDTDCPVCKKDASKCEGTALEVSGDTVTATAPVDEDGKVDANVNVSSEQAATMVGNATNGTVKVEVEVTGSAAGVKEVNVVLSTDLITAVKGASAVTTVEVTTTIATVALPASSLSTSNNTLTVKAATTNATVLGGVSLTLGSMTEFSAPVTVTVNVTTTVTNPLVAYLNNGRYFRVRQNPADSGAFTFFTRHFSDFVVVDGDATVPEAIEMENTGSGRNHVYAIEADEALVAAVKASDGTLNYMSVGPVAEEMLDNTVNARVNAPDAEIDNVCAIIGEMNLNGDGTPNITDEDTVSVDPNFGEIL